MNVDRNLLLGILAFKLNFIDRATLIATINSWEIQKARPLEALFVDRGHLSKECCQSLMVLVQEHLSQHDGDPEKSLWTLMPSSDERAAIASQIVDRDLQTRLERDLGNTLGGNEGHTISELKATTGCAASEPGATDNRFKILRPHAKGGLGKVSVALDRELGREVALKEIQEQYSHSETSRVRFMTEAEVTGGLEHPGIVPVYGMGQDSHGRPFYAMRLIQGTSLKEAIKNFHDPQTSQLQSETARRLELRSLLGRLIDVCNAIEYAHSRGVLHRDIKPSNIMLGKFGETLVVDWGLAKIIGRDVEPESDVDSLGPAYGLPHDSAPTRIGAAVGTPAFMSPEQAAGRIDQVGPASDVYSLGATLYAILTGHNPFHSTDATGGILEVVQQGNFRKPSQHEKQIPKALESICLKAMQTNPDERYATPLAMAADLDDWLADEPVGAHRESVSERLSRWERKNRSNVRAGSLALMLVTTAAIVALFGINAARRLETEQRVRADRNAAHERLAADAARQAERAAHANLARAVSAEKQSRDSLLKATRVANSSAEVSDFLANLFLGSDPNGLGGGVSMVDARSKNISALELLKHGAQSLDKHVKSKDEIRAKLTGTLGFIFSAYAEYEIAKPLIDESLELHRKLYDRNAPELAQSLKHAGVLYHFFGDYRKARKYVREALAICEHHYGPDSEEAAEMLFLVGWYIGGEGTNPTLLAESEQRLRRAIEIQQRLCLQQNDQVFLSRMALADIIHQQGRDLEAIILASRTAASFSKQSGDPRPSELASAMLLGTDLAGSLNWQSIAEKLTAAHQKTTEMFGKHHPFVRFFETQIGNILEAGGDTQLAESYWRNRVEMESKSFADGPWTARRMEDLARFLVRHQRFADAEEHFLEALRIRRITTGGDSIYVGRILNELAMVAFRQHEWEQARHWIDESLAAYDVSSEDHPETVRLWRQCAIENRTRIYGDTELTRLGKAFTKALGKESSPLESDERSP